MNITRRSCLFAALSTALGAGPQLASAQAAWPNKVVRVLVGYTAGGPTDNAARVFATRLSAELGQQFIVENRPGAGGTLAATAVAKAAPDGYTLLLGEPGSMAVAAAQMPQLAYNPVKDFIPIAQVVSQPMVLVAAPSLQVADLKGLLALAKAKPLPFGTPGAGTMQHLTLSEFGRQNGVSFTHVAYKGGGPAMIDLLGGQIPLAMVTIPSVLPYIKDKKVVPLAVVAARRFPLLAQTPTFAEQGFPGFVQDSWQGFFAPAGTPADVIAKLAAAMAKIGHSPDVQASLTASGTSVVYSPPQEFAATVRRDAGYWAKVVESNPAARE
jgi:tripartite-type tricarboxylate transporter receptor subunit TctC